MEQKHLALVHGKLPQMRAGPPPLPGQGPVIRWARQSLPVQIRQRDDYLQNGFCKSEGFNY